MFAVHATPPGLCVCAAVAAGIGEEAGCALHMVVPLRGPPSVRPRHGRRHGESGWAQRGKVSGLRGTRKDGAIPITSLSPEALLQSKKMPLYSTPCPEAVTPRR